jgi:hypothetical protein
MQINCKEICDEIALRKSQNRDNYLEELELALALLNK